MIFAQDELSSMLDICVYTRIMNTCMSIDGNVVSSSSSARTFPPWLVISPSSPVRLSQRTAAHLNLGRDSPFNARQSWWLSGGDCTDDNPTRAFAGRMTFGPSPFCQQSWQVCKVHRVTNGRRFVYARNRRHTCDCNHEKKHRMRVLSRSMLDSYPASVTDESKAPRRSAYCLRSHRLLSFRRNRRVNLIQEHVSAYPGLRDNGDAHLDAYPRVFSPLSSWESFATLLPSTRGGVPALPGTMR